MGRYQEVRLGRRRIFECSPESGFE